MRKQNWILLLLLPLTLFISGCSSSGADTGQGAVEALCDCFLDAGIENEYDLMDLDHDKDQLKKVVKCALPILKDVRSELDDMDDEERAEYFGDAIKAAVDCECGVKLLEIAGKLYDTEDGEEGLDELIFGLEWLADHDNDSFFYGEDAEEEYYEEEYYNEDDYYGEEYPEYGEEEEGCYGDYYALENDLVYDFMNNIANGNIRVGSTTRSDMEYYVGESESYYRDYYGVHVSGYMYYTGGVLSSISLDYYYDCEGVMGYVDLDKNSITYAIEEALDKSGTYDGDYEDAAVNWTFNGMSIRQSNYSDGYSVYIEAEDAF